MLLGRSFAGLMYFSHKHVPISAYLWSFAIALFPPDFSCLGLLVSQLWLLNEDAHQVPRGFPLCMSQWDVLSRQVSESITGLTSLVSSWGSLSFTDWYPVPQKYFMKMNTLYESAVSHILCFFRILRGRITPVLVIHGKWKWKSSQASWKLESYARKLSLPPTHAFYSPQPTSDILLIHLLQSLKYTPLWSCVNQFYLDYFIHVLLLILLKRSSWP